ncbi:unnamed protein product, partial [Ostreobium quekettii]
GHWIKQKLQPHDPDMGGLKVVGEGIEGKLWEAVNREITMKDIEKILRATNPEALEAVQEALQQGNRSVEEAESEAGGPDCRGPLMALSSDRLLFHANRGDISERALTLENVGTTALYYEWLEGVPEMPKVAGGARRERRFFLYDAKGAVLPGASKEFRFAFRSNSPGIFVEKWSVRIAPGLERPPPVVTLRGMAVAFDDHSFRRSNIIKELERKE